MNKLLPLLLLLAASAVPVAANAGLFDELEFRHIGPVGNRVPAVVGVSGDPSTYYAGAASGGIWKSVDHGVRWQPIFDQHDVSSIGSLAVAPSDANVIWAGTGETFIRSNVSIGNGIYRSTDAGETWRHMGLRESGRIGRIVVHPRNDNVVYAAALGHSYGPQPERGLYRTRDGGENWEQILFVDTNTGAIDLVMDPHNPRILYAATWQFQMRTSGRDSGGPGSGIYRSKDGGDTWTQLGPQTDSEHAAKANGTPKGPWGKIGLAISADQPKRIYALIETSSNSDYAPVEGWDGPGYQGVLWRSDDRGDNWTLVSRDNTLHQRPLYYTRMMAAPDNADELTFMSVQQSFSIDGGKTITAQQSGWDHHDIWIDPLNPDRRITGHDGGVSITHDRGKNWFRPQLPVAQVYHVNVDDQVPYFVYGNRQDGPSMKGPSNTLSGGGIPMSAWQSVGGCEVGFAVPTPGAPDIVWTGCYDGILERYDAKTGHARDVSVKPLAVESWPGIDLEYRFQWSFPIEVSPHDPEVVYVGSQYVHRTDDDGTSWSTISPDLSTGNEELILRTGGLTYDDAGPTIAAVVFAIAESRLEPGQIWAGTNDGRLHVTRDNGTSWTDVGINLPDAPTLGTISQIDPSSHDPARAYVAVDGHQEGDTGTHIYATDNYGSTWRSLRANIQQDTLSYAHSIKEDPEVPGLLYLGLHNQLMVSLDDGRSWQRLGEGSLPPAPVSWIEVQEHFGDLVLSTYGRGFFILDDLSAIRHLAAAAQAERTIELELVAPRSAYRFRNVEATMSVPDIPADGHNPEYGVPLHYVLSDEGPAPAEIKLEIVDAQGEVVRTLEDQPSDPGLHRIWWNLRGDSTTRPKRVLPPRDAEHNKPGIDAGPFSLLQSPGTYTVRLVATPEDEENSEQSSRQVTTTWSDEQTLVIEKDPGSTGTLQDIKSQMSVLERLRASIDQAARLTNDLETLRGQTRSWRARIDEAIETTNDTESASREPVTDSGEAEPADLSVDLAELETEMEAIEHELVDLRITSARQDSLRWKRKLLAQLNYLARRIHKTDHAPTEAQRKLAEQLISEVSVLQDRFGELENRTAGINLRINEAGLGSIAPQP